MAETLYKWLLDIPQTIAQFGNWLTEPIYEPYIKLSPLALLGIGGLTALLVILGVHIVRLFV